MNPTHCPCKRLRCERHGNCEACRAHHQGKSLPRCEKLAQKKQRPARRHRKRGKEDSSLPQ